MNKEKPLNNEWDEVKRHLIRNQVRFNNMKKEVGENMADHGRQQYFTEFETKLMADSDSFIINSLLMHGIDWPTIFSLLWGNDMATSIQFPSELRKIAADIVREKEKLEQSSDSEEKQLHSIIIDLLGVLYEKQVNDTVESVNQTEK